MRLTQALAIRNLIAKLHPPLPPTPRESQQLLSVLQKSFNRRLDDVHPSPQVPANLRSHETAEYLPDVGNMSASAANAHLQAILNHPSLEHTAASSAPTSPVKIVELFDAAILAQSVNFSLIRSCVKLAKTSPISSVEAARQLGPRIAAWFTASEATIQRSFLTDSGLMSKVLPLMYRADLEGTVWDWLRTLYEGSAQQQQSTELLAEDRFVALMTRESIKRNDLTAAVLEYSEACDYRSSRSLSGYGNPLIVTGNLVSSAVLLRRQNHGIPAPLYDRLLSYETPVPVRPESVLWPFLPIYHPTAARSRPLYQALQDSKYLEALLLKVGAMKRDRAAKILIGILDGAALMLSQGPRAKAQFILDFAQQQFPTMLLEKKSADIAEVIQEARSYVATHKHVYHHIAAT
jgi:hypothetical protein